MKTVGESVTKYVYGVGLIGEESNNSFKTYHFDYRGSTVAITDSTGAVTDTFTYDSYGNLLSKTGTTDTPFMYNGEYGVVTDNNGLLYMRARYYSSELRRFVNADILMGDINNSPTLNRYAYANGNPISNIDPFGMTADNSRGGMTYTVEYRKDINGIGLLADGTILAGKNFKESDIEMLKKIANMTYSGKSNAEILSMVNEYYLKMKKDTVIKDGKLLDYYTSFEDITDYLNAYMLREEYLNTTYYNNDGELVSYSDNPLLWTLYLGEFYDSVRLYGKWDLKQKERWKQSSLYYYNGELVDSDAPGNIMFGYIGKAYGIPTSVLHTGAGVAQILSSNSSIKWLSSFFDDPMDRKNVDRGISWFNKIH